MSKTSSFTSKSSLLFSHFSCRFLSTLVQCPPGLWFHSQLCNQCTRIDWLLLFSCSVVSDSLWPHGLQHARLPCPSLPPRVCSVSYPSSRWCHPTVSFSVTASLPALCLSQHQGLSQWDGSLHQVAKGLELQYQSFQRLFRVDFLQNWFRPSESIVPLHM